MNQSFKTFLPREHGAWAMFIVPLWVGISAAGVFNFEVALFALTAFGFFLVRYPTMLALKNRARDLRRDAIRWSVMYGALTGIGAIALMAISQIALLIPLGALGALSLAIYLWHAARRVEMTLLGEWIGIAGLALGAPGAYLVATRALDTTAFAIYVLNVVYFGGTVFYIKFKVREQPRVVPPDATWRAHVFAGRVTLAYHALAFALIIAFAVICWLPALVVIAFAPAVCKALGGVLTRQARLNIRRLGFIELGLSIAFSLIVFIAYRY